MNRRNFFTTLFSSAIAGTCAVLAPRYYPSVNGVRGLTTKVYPLTWTRNGIYDCNATLLDEHQRLILRQYFHDSLRGDLALANRIVSKRSSVASD